MWSLFFVFFLGCYGVSDAIKRPLPSYIEACHKEDPKIDECARNNALLAIPQLVKGDRKLGFPKMDPLELESVEVETGGNLSIGFHKLKVYGLDTMDVKKIKVDLAGKSLRFDLKASVLDLLGQYKLDGRILVIPLKGNGACNLTVTNIDINFELKYDLEKRDGDTYMVLGEHDMDINLEHFHVQFDNLFDGNEELGKSTNKILNEEWKTLYVELKPAISKTISTIVLTIVTSLTEKVPYDQIFI